MLSESRLETFKDRVQESRRAGVASRGLDFLSPQLMPEAADVNSTSLSCRHDAAFDGRNNSFSAIWKVYLASTVDQSIREPLQQ